MSKGTLHFWKMAGAGNDFVVIDARAGLPVPAAELAARLCPRRVAVGADGLIAVTAVAGARVTVDFYNADGSQAGFCGNGARCVGRYALLREFAAAPLTLAFPGLTVRAREAGDGGITIETPRPRLIEPLPPLVEPLPGSVERPPRGELIEAGVAHAVFDENGAPLDRVAETLFAARPDLQDRVNITLVHRVAPATLRIRTLERGAGETLACGSAALAAAFYSAQDRAGGLRVTVFPPAGIPLAITLEPDGGGATLSGEARLVYRAEIDL